MPQLTIYLKSHQGIAAMVGISGAQVISANGGHFLKNNFSLEVAGQSSGPVTFDEVDRPAKVVKNSEGEWELAAMEATSFSFSPRFRIQKSEKDAWISAPSARLAQVEGQDEPSYLAFDYPCVSMVGPWKTVKDGVIFYPQYPGEIVSANVNPIPYPGQSFEGYFILPHPTKGGFAVFFGTASKTLNLNFAQKYLNVTVREISAESMFRLTDQNGDILGQLDFVSILDDGLAIELRKESKVAFKEIGAPSARERLYVTELSVRGGRIRAEAGSFVDDKISIAALTDGSTRTQDASQLRGSGEMFSFQLDIPDDGKFDPVKHGAEFRFEDKDFFKKETDNSDKRRRYYGLRIPGVSSTRGRREPIDTSLATIKIRGNTMSSRFQLKAGGMLDTMDGDQNSVVIPKADPRLNDIRRIDIAAGPLMLRVETGEYSAGSKGTFELDTSTKSLKIRGPELIGPPAGITAKKAGQGTFMDGDPATFKNWSLVLQDVSTLDFDITTSGVFPSKGDDWPVDFVSRQEVFDALEKPGMKIAIDRSAKDANLMSFNSATENVRTIVEKGKIEVANRPDKEILIYSVFFAGVSYAALKVLVGEKDAIIPNDDIKIVKKELKSKDAQKYVKRNAVDDLIVVYSTQGGNDSSPTLKALKKFIDDNDPGPSNGQTVERLLWPFAMGLGLTMYQVINGTKKYCWTISKERKFGSPAIAFDFSKQNRINPGDMVQGWSMQTWKHEFARERPALWPKLSGSNGTRLDPSAKRWTGVFFCNMPMLVPIDATVLEQIRKNSEVLYKLYNEFEKRLQLKYGWIDDTGTTWNAEIVKQIGGYDITPNKWKCDLKITLETVTVFGAAGQPVGGNAMFEFELLKIVDENTRNPIKIKAEAGVDVSKSPPITSIAFRQEGSAIYETEDIPGFKSIRLLGLETDFKMVHFDVALMPTDKLSQALPIFKKNTLTEARITLNLSSDPSMTVELKLESEVETNLFGKWPYKLQSIILNLTQGQQALVVRGTVGLGVSGFVSVGTRCILSRVDSDWNLDVELDEISGEFSIGDFEVAGSLKWETAGSNGKRTGGAIPASELATVGREREFWGLTQLKGGKLLGESIVLVKVGSKGELSYWIGGVLIDTEIDIGSAKLERPAVVISHNADKDGKLRQTLTDVTKPATKELRPPDSPEKQTKWLGEWQASEDIGTLVAASGYFKFEDRIAKSPEGREGGESGKYMTSVVVTDSGLFRIDAVTALFGSQVLPLAFAIDTKEKIISVGIQLPKISLPNKTSPDTILDPGYMSMTTSYGKKLMFEISIGWPTLIGASELERDWSKSIKLYKRELVPINTVMGGYRARIEVDPTRIRFGWALKAGWTWKTELTGNNLADARADVGITVGGVLEFLINFDAEDAQLVPNDATVDPAAFQAILAAESMLRDFSHISISKANPDELRSIRVASELILASVNKGADLQMSATLYGDVWGRGSVVFLGVTLASIDLSMRVRFKVCGTLKKGITYAFAQGSVSLKVTILCVEYDTSASFDVWLKRGVCEQMGNGTLLGSPNDIFAHSNSPIPELIPEPKLIESGGAS